MPTTRHESSSPVSEEEALRLVEDFGGELPSPGNFLPVASFPYDGVDLVADCDGYRLVTWFLLSGRRSRRQ